MKIIFFIIILLFFSIYIYAPENNLYCYFKKGEIEMLSDRTIDFWKKRFIPELEEQIGKRYVLGGGQMVEYKGHDNLDEDGNPIGFDCCGGIVYAIERVTGLELYGRPVQSFLNTVWLNEIEEKDLREGDLILVDIPGMKSGNLLKNKKGEIIYGKFNHVMTYAPYGKYDIITTEGVGGDYRINPSSSTTTRRWKFSEFKRVSSIIYKKSTKYKFMRINWDWFFNYKKSHQV